MGQSKVLPLGECAIDPRRRRRMDVQLGILADAGHALPRGATVLDLGCGNGDLVNAYRQQGYRAYGCDFAFKPGRHADDLARQGYIRRLQPEPYRLPFEDQMFDLVVSNEVFEHVSDYESTLAEHRRVLKPDGVGLHFIPSRYSPIELHVFVPFATVLQEYWWLRLWAALGVRTAAQKHMSAAERARWNTQYLKNHTNYLTKRELTRAFERHFASVTYREDLFLKYSQRARPLHKLSRVLPFIPALYGTLRSRILLCAQPRSSPGSQHDSA
ncbi:MAG TPA: class I SAM-dependent methyltransferase [Steroidobacter sp.]